MSETPEPFVEVGLDELGRIVISTGAGRILMDTTQARSLAGSLLKTADRADGGDDSKGFNLATLKATLPMGRRMLLGSHLMLDILVEQHAHGAVQRGIEPDGKLTAATIAYQGPAAPQLVDMFNMFMSKVHGTQPAPYTSPGLIVIESPVAPPAADKPDRGFNRG